MRYSYLQHVILLVLLVILQPSFTQSSALASSLEPKREMRATWLATHYAIDWPKTYVTSTGNTTQINAQKAELTTILDKLVAGNMNAFCFQVRPTSDALYQSSYEPWSKNLSGTRGLNPGYDPLAYAIQEGHKRGLEVHVWVNPFRVTTSGTLATSDPVWQNCNQWLIKYDNGSFSGQIIDPGYPAARAYVIKVLMEIINNYDVDGILMDDYFYPYGGTTTEDAASKALYKPAGMADGDWRRQNVDQTIEALYDSIQQVKPWVRFGMGPFGIWTTQSAVATKYGITLPKGITGLDDYAVQACNTVEWVKQGYVDYIAPQLYWATTSTGQDYDVLCQWWSQDVCQHFSSLLPGDKRVDFFSSQATYKFNTSEVCLEIDDNRNFNPQHGSGSIFYNTTSYVKDNGQGTTNMHLAVAQSRFTHKALPPAMDWKSAPTMAAPTALSLNGTTLTWQHPSADRFTVYVYPKGTDAQVTSRADYLYQVCYGKQLSLASVADLQHQTLAVCAYDRFGNEFAPVYFNRAEHEERDTIAVHVTGISLRLKETTMKVGQQITLKPTVKPSNATVKTVLWTSDNVTVVTVDEAGVMTAVAPGEAVVTGTTLDGGFTVECAVTVAGGSTDILAPEADMAERMMVLINGRMAIRVAVAGQTHYYTLTGQLIE